MRLSTSSLLLLPAFVVASAPAAPAPALEQPSNLDTAATSASSISPASLPTDPHFIPVSTVYNVPQRTPAPVNGDLKREVVDDETATTAVTQASPITTYYVWTTIGGVAQEVAIIYTQTFASVPDQWSSPSSGTIGWGTISTTKKKRDVEPTGVAEAVEKRGVIEEREEENVKREENSATGAVVGKAGASSLLGLAIAVAVMIAF